MALTPAPAELLKLMRVNTQACLIGEVITSILFGISTAQTFAYYKAQRSGCVYIRGLVGLLWALDALHLALIAHAVYFYATQNLSQSGQVDDRMIWSLLGQIVVTDFTSLLVRTILSLRVWKVSSRSLLYSFPPIVLSLVAFVTGIIFAAKGLGGWGLDRLMQLKSLLYISFTASSAADLFLAGAMGSVLWDKRTGFSRTDHILDNNIVLYVNIGLVTSLFSVAGLIIYAAMPDNFVFIAFFFTLNPIYLNALLLSLNWKFMARRSSTTSLLPKHSDHDSDKVWPKVRHNVERNSWPDFGQPLAIKVETSTHQVADDDARNIVDKIESITSSTSGTME